jgi:hypothetical protein
MSAARIAIVKHREIRVMGGLPLKDNKNTACQHTGTGAVYCQMMEVGSTRGAPLFVLVAILLVAGSALPVRAEEATSPQETAEDEDPTKTVLFNVRLEHRELLDGDSAQVLTLRRDWAIPPARQARPHHKYALLRFDLPFAQIDRAGVTESGLGDLYFQALHVHPIHRGFALASGTGLLLPTASEDSLGTGKWVIAPAVVPIWFLPKIRGLALVKIQDYVSVAGDEARADIHAMTVTPTLLRSLGQRGFMLLDTESRTDWRDDGRTSWRSGVQMGRVINPGWGFWVKVEVPWGEHRMGDWTLRTSLVRREVR